MATLKLVFLYRSQLSKKSIGTYLQRNCADSSNFFDIWNPALHPFDVLKMELSLLLHFCVCLNLVEGTDKRILGGIPVFDYFGKYISFNDNFGDRT